MRTALIMAVVCGLGLAATTRVASAQSQPWADGVSEDQKNAAKAKLEEGNKLYLATDYKAAADAYTEALKSWNHPAIRFNLVRSQVQLNLMVEAGDNLEQCLKYDAAPFTSEVWQEVLGYKKLLARMVGQIEVGCSQDGAKLTFDGKPFIEKCPGKQTTRVPLGQHSIVATKDGFLTKEMPVVVIGGDTPQNVDVKLVPLDKAAKVVHKWPTWIPWVVFASGLAVTGAGVFLEVDAQNRMNQYDQDVASQCAVNGCMLDSPEKGSMEERLNETKSSAESRDKLAIGVMSVGIAGAVVGGVLLFLNRGQTVYEDPLKQQGPVVNVSPTRDGDGVVTSLSGHF